MDRKFEGKITKILVQVPHTLYERFKRKSLSEGYSLQKATYLLIEHYTSDVLTMKDDTNK